MFAFGLREISPSQRFHEISFAPSSLSFEVFKVLSIPIFQLRLLPSRFIYRNNVEGRERERGRDRFISIASIFKSAEKEKESIRIRGTAG